ncbi:MAG: hypothetical protein A2428_14570 [Bdellovibrionales bacterium RIFOXYC1_FULL_54_43]|nr:MAG: hypothetical protein A2428_14570 [Bdellovibrionales bacterium RIFOXYC1_FULL_54_43]
MKEKAKNSSIVGLEFKNLICTGQMLELVLVPDLSVISHPDKQSHEPSLCTQAGLARIHGPYVLLNISIYANIRSSSFL